jgi:hypothetical protein
MARSSTDRHRQTSDDASPRFPPIASLAHVSPDEIWDLLIADAASEAAAGRGVSLRRYLDSVVGISEHPEAIQAAIAATIENQRRLGRSNESVVRELKQEHPDLGEHIDQLTLIEAIVGDQDEPEFVESEARPLPSPYGRASDTHPHRYVLHELLGAGTRGMVYKALDQTTSSPDRPVWVAIKIVPRWSGMRRKEVLAEARRAARVDHESVARILDTGTDDEGGCYVVCEYIDGRTLVDVRESTPGGLDARSAVRMLLPAIRGMGAAHMGGLVHLDIHPRNILIDANGRSRLIDFGHGVAKFEAWRPARRPMGSLGFVAPEIYQREPDPLLSRADVYSLAGVLLWFITGRVPNGETIEESEHRLCQQIASGQTPGCLEEAGLDRDLAHILAKALSRQPSERHDSAQGLAADLEAWLGHRPIAWTRPSLARQAVLLSRRSPGTVLAVAAVLAVIVVATALLTRQRIENAAELRIADAERRAEVAGLEAERLAEQAEIGQKLEAFATSARGFVMTMNRTRPAGRDWIIMLTLISDLADAGLELDADVLATTYEQKLDIARDRHTDAVARFGAGDIQSRLWQGALIAWFIDAGRLDDAGAELEAAIASAEQLQLQDSITRRLVTLRDALGAIRAEDGERRRALARGVLQLPDSATLPESLVDRLREAAE